MSVFVDTSAFYALSDRSDEMYSQAREAYQNLLDKEVLLVTSSYIIVETLALMQRRLGLPVVRKF
ncbi:VapC toxin family PIN domain ribonuclease, partial [candidate division NPL-UPA2 bacterium]|nr:VapC toxin family PIN domain ribonuclease [candidate division NPL-UPA2 bacterium]